MSERPSKGVYISAWALMIFSVIQMFFVPSAFREFSFLPPVALWACLAYLVAYNLTALFAAASSLKLKQWTRGLLIVILLVGIADKAVFVPLRLKALERVGQEPQLRGLLIREYRKSLPPAPGSGPIPDEVILRRAISDLRAAQKAIELLWVVFLISLLSFYANPGVRAQFDEKRKGISQAG